MVDSIAATSLLGHRPVGGNLISDASGKRKSCRFPPSQFLGGRLFVSLPLPKSKQYGFLLSSSIKALAVDRTREDKQESITNLTKVSMTITKHLLSKPEFNEKNVMISPLSLQTVLSILAAGSEGPTQQQLLDFLGSESISHLNSLSSHLASSLLKDAAPAGGPCLSSANSVWVEKTLSLYPSFKETVATDYMATLESLDFINKADEAAKIVNLWAEKKTNGLIKDFLSPGSIDSLTRIIFANALYFKGAWSQQFDASETKDYDFHLLNGSSIKAPFMTNEKMQFVSAFDGFKVLRLPYKQGNDKRQFSMYFFLPDAKDGLLTLIEKVTSDSEFLKHILPYKKVEVGDFRIPSFKISFGLELSNALKELGVVLPFSDIGLTKMVDSQIWASNILQKSFIEVNEKGTKAAAVTSIGPVGCALSSSTPITIDFVADHPFLFLIREDLSGTILFVGQVLNPIHIQASMDYPSIRYDL